MWGQKIKTPFRKAKMCTEVSAVLGGKEGSSLTKNNPFTGKEIEMALSHFPTKINYSWR